MSAGRRWLRWGLVAVAVIVLVVALVRAAGGGSTADAPPLSSQTSGQVVRDDIGFRSGRRLDEHYLKHGHEFGSPTREEYLRMAQTLRDAPVGGAILEARRDDGVVTRFDRTSGAFIAFDSHGIIRTYFRPNDGEAYFRRQARR